MNSIQLKDSGQKFQPTEEKYKFPLRVHLNLGAKTGRTTNWRLKVAKTDSLESLP
jgi:hypothetical protein